MRKPIAFGISIYSQCLVYAYKTDDGYVVKGINNEPLGWDKKEDVIKFMKVCCDRVEEVEELDEGK